MLAEHDRELLTAYVDGVLSARQRRHVVKLLKRSQEARRLLSLLQDDSGSLIALPAVPKLSVDLSRSVENKIRERGLTPVRHPVQPAAKPVPAWMGLAIAASVLVALSAASYFGFGAYFASHWNGPSTQVVKKDDTSTPTPTPLPEETPTVVRENPKPTPDEFVGPRLPEKPNDDPVVSNPPVVVPPKPDERDPLKPDPLKPDALFGDRPVPSKERFIIERVEVGPQPFIKELQLLSQAGVRAELLDYLKLGGAFRVELPSANGTQAMERLLAACKGQKLPLHVDQTAQRRLNMKQTKTNYVLYVENLTHAELTTLLQTVAVEDKQAAMKKPADARFAGIVVRHLTRHDDEGLSRLLGIEVNELAPAKGAGPLGTDLSRPLPEQTADQVAKALAARAVAKADQKQVLVLAYNPVEPAKNSAEVKRFLEARIPVKSDAVRALIVLRSSL